MIFIYDLSLNNFCNQEMAKKLPVFGLRAGIYKIWSKNGTTLHTELQNTNLSLKIQR